MKQIWMRLIVLLAVSFSALSAEEVQVREAPVSFPAYRLGEPERLPVWKPRFGRIYPYTMQDKLTDIREPRTYHGLWLENEYVRALVLPQIGGRLHGAWDKSRNYPFIFDQRTIKPALVGMSGAWISGGIEWNFPDGHRVSGFRDSDWRITVNADGSKTVWTGEIEHIYGMRWSAGNTVHPGRTWIETRVRLFNCTPVPQAYLYWADCAVRGTPQFTAVIPGEIATGHGKHKFYRWPLDNGVDLRKWENAPGGTSYFAWDSESEYFGSWSPEERGGLAHWADHQIVRGKKLWFCGTSPAGRLWEVVLTDNDLPLVEPQAGAYSDNQPDYHWLMPGETKVFSHYWFPVADIGLWAYANLEGALALEPEGKKVRIGWSPTGMNEKARGVLTAAGETIFSRGIDASPAAPFLERVNTPREADLYSYRLAVLSSRGDTLLAFSHPRPLTPPLPEPEPPFPAPEIVESPEKLYLMGDHLERFRDHERALEYYREALKRDAGDLRTNIALGLMLLKQGLYPEAQKHFETALRREPWSGAANYYRGLACLRLGDSAGAEKYLNRSAYDQAWYAAAQFELAQLICSNGKLAQALEHIQRSIQGNGDNAQAWAVKALILNRMGCHAEALAAADSIQQADRLDLLSLAERGKVLAGLGRRSEAEAATDSLLALTRLDSDNHLELALRYARCGSFADAAGALEVLAKAVDSVTVSPLVYYYLARYKQLEGKEQAAEEYLALAAQAPLDYCFPSRLETIPVLEWAIGRNPRDARALYLLGTLYFSLNRVEESIAALQKSTALDKSNAIAWRNLGYALAQRKELGGACAAYEAALAADSTLPLAILELDRVYFDLSRSETERLAFLERHRGQALRSDPLIKRLISLYVQLGRYDQALEMLSSHRFHSWEGGYGVHLYWVESQIRKGDSYFEAGDYAKALERYRLALTYPDNLEVKEQPHTIHARKLYKIGLAQEALKKRKDAKAVFEKVAGESPAPGDPFQYFRGKALEKLGRNTEAQEVFKGMLAYLDRGGAAEETHGPGQTESEAELTDKRKALSHFKRSLALEGLGRNGEADEEREAALKLDPEVVLSAFCPPEAGW